MRAKSRELLLYPQPTNNIKRTQHTQTWRVLREADPDIVEAVLERADHLRDPRVAPLEHPEVRDGREALRAALVLP